MSLTQRIAGLTWEGCNPPADDRTMDELEQTLGVKFPLDFRRVMQLCQGGTPVERNCFKYRGAHGSGIGALLSVDPDDEENILGTMELLSHDDQLPHAVIPFADDGGGDMMCLDYRNDPEHPRVVYWSHEQPRESSISPLADSFTEFLDSLQPPIDIDALLSKE